MTHNEMITNQFGEQYLYAVNRNMFEQEPARERIEREFGSLLAREDSLIIFVGSDSGNIIHYLLAQELPAGTRYIFIEPEDILKQVAATVDMSPAEGRIWLVTPEGLKDAVQDAGITSYIYVDGVFLKRCLSAEYGFLPRYRSQYWDAEGYIHELRWATLVSLGQDAFIWRQLQNCADNLRPISDIRGCLEGRTVIVLGGGPSLDQHLDWIQARRNQLVVFAVSRISARLQQVGLEPDFVFSVDPTETSYQISREMLNFGPRVVFINQYHVVPGLLAQWPHKKFFMGPLLPWESELNPAQPFNGSGPTVTNSAIAAAAWLGSRRILLAGVDLCFTPEGYTHAEGSRERAAGPKTDLSSLMLETNGGEQASTTPDFAAAARNISQQAEVLKAQGVELINISASAARLENVTYRAPAEISLVSAAGPFELPEPRTTDRSEWLQTLQQELRDKQAQMDEIVELLEQAIKLHSGMYDNGKVNPQDKRELEQIDSRLAEQYPELFRMVKTLSVRGLLRMAQSFRDTETLELEEIRQHLDIYYTSLEQGARCLNGYLTAAQDSIDVRLRELKLSDSTPEELAQLARRWIERGEPGRALLPQAVTAGQDWLAEAREAFRAEMARGQQTLIQQSRLQNLHALPMRIQYLKDRGDVEALEILRQALLDTEEARGYLPLIEASIHQMRQEPDQALAKLLPVMEQPESPILEQTLGMMVDLCTELEYHQAVMDAMAGLASLNAFYLNLYADALMANGQAGDAIEHLTEYLHYFPGDRQAIRKLGRWYADQGSEEGVALTQALLQAQLAER